MGAGQSTSSREHPPSRALHVLRVTPDSPAFHSDIEPFFDFVVGFDGDSTSSRNHIDVSELEQIVDSHEGRTLKLLVWNSKRREMRVVPIVPSREWSLPHSDSLSEQEPGSKPQPSLLGLSMRICEPELTLDNVWHVLDVLEGSPAESAGLVPYGDWIVGWSGGVLNAEDDFYHLVEAHVDKPLRVIVYSYDFDNLREVILVPNREWGGEGLLGCVFGFGLLHRIPPQPAERLIPLELQEDYTNEEQELFVPADIQQPGDVGPTDTWQGHQGGLRQELVQELGNHSQEADYHHDPIDFDENGSQSRLSDEGHPHQTDSIEQRPWRPTDFTSPSRTHSIPNGNSDLR